MVGRRFAASSFFGFAVLCTDVSALAQGASKEKSPPADPAKGAGKLPSQADLRDAVKRKALIDKMIADYDLTPHPSPTIPDNPPPREGALINLPYVVEPPDLILVEVLEALPGRPISGERLVRPDGMISLGWYGDIQVRGLTVPQIKVAIIKHLRKFLNDADLGLAISDAGESEIPQPERVPIPPERVPIPPLPENANPFDPDEAPKPIKKTSSATPAQPRTGKSGVRPAPPHVAGRRKPVRFIPVRGTRQEPAAAPESPKAPAQINIPAGATGRITITIDLGGPARPAVEPGQIPVPAIEPAAPGTEESWTLVPPEESQRVFVDVTAYNCMNYYVQGDVATIGRFPYTGNETVFDILQFAGGLLSTADPKQITLVRPERNGKPAKVYKIDLEAIQQRGEVATNYQVFPGDRLFVGRNEVVKKTVEIDRLNAPIQSMTAMMLQEAFMLRALQMVSIDHRDELLKEYVDFWAKELSRSGGVKFDEQTLRDAFIRKMKLIPAPVPANPSR